MEYFSFDYFHIPGKAMAEYVHFPRSYKRSNSRFVWWESCYQSNNHFCITCTLVLKAAGIYRSNNLFYFNKLKDSYTNMNDKSLAGFKSTLPCLRGTMVQRYQEYSLTHPFARTAHSFACSALLALLARSAALTRSLAHFTLTHTHTHTHL